MKIFIQIYFQLFVFNKKTPQYSNQFFVFNRLKSFTLKSVGKMQNLGRAFKNKAFSNFSVGFSKCRLYIVACFSLQKYVFYLYLSIFLKKKKDKKVFFFINKEI